MTNRKAIRLGLRADLAQFTLLVAVNALGPMGSSRWNSHPDDSDGRA